MGSLSLTWLLTWRYFRARRDRGLVSLVTGFSVSGIALGVAALITAMAVFTGFRLELRQRLYDVEAPIRVQALEKQPLQWREDYTDLIKGVPGVKAIIPYINAPSILMHGGQAQGALFRGLDLEQFSDLPFATYVREGQTRFDRLDAEMMQPAPALIGTAMAQTMGLILGDEMRAYKGGQIQQNQATPSLPGTQVFYVAGIFQTGIEEVDQSLIITSAVAARSLTALPDGPIFDGAQVYLDDTLNALKTLDKIAAVTSAQTLVSQSTLAYNPERDGRLGFSVATHLRIAREQEAAMVVVLSLIVIVAAFGVIAAQIMKVQEKSREIAVLRSFGAGAGLILRIFLLLGLLTGLLGALVGLSLGLILVTNLEIIRGAMEGWLGLSLFPADQFRLAFLPSRPTFGSSFLAVSVALLLTQVAVAYPAVRAARLSPAEALRYA